MRLGGKEKKVSSVEKKVNDGGGETVTGAMFSTPALPVSAVDGQSERVARSRLNGHFIQIERP